MKKSKKSIIKLNVNDKIKILTEFYNKFKREPKSREEYKGYAIGQIWYNIKRGRCKISNKEKNILEKIGYDFSIMTLKERSENRIKILTEFYNEFNREPKTGELYKGTKPYYFLRDIRCGIVKISDEDKKILSDLGYRLYSGVAQEGVSNKVKLLIEFYELYHREPKREDVYQGSNIGIFLVNLRQGLINIKFKDCQNLVKAGIRIF